jgi:hypothetical protein
LIINENGNRKAITKSRVLAKQLVNKAASGSIQAARLVISLSQRAQERAAEQQQSSANKPDYENLKPEDLTDEELLMIVQGIHPKYSGNR